MRETSRPSAQLRLLSLPRCFVLYSMQPTNEVWIDTAALIVEVHPHFHVCRLRDLKMSLTGLNSQDIYKLT